MPQFSYYILTLMTPVATILIVLGALARSRDGSWKPNDAFWKNMVQAWLYLVAFTLVSHYGITFFLLAGCAACLIALAIGYFSPTPRDKKLYYTIAKENVVVLVIALLVNTFFTSYLAIKKGSFDMSFEASLILGVYSLVVLGVCVNVLSIGSLLEETYPEWRTSVYRGWYYTLFAWILATWGVEVVMLSASTACWVGVLIGKRYEALKQPVGCVLARENITFITVFWVIRSFIYQPFIVPTGSLEPTILPGDFVLVNQYAYGLRFPVWGWKIYPIGTPQRGDLVVFRYPKDPNTLYVKRLIGLPGERIQIVGNTITINGIEVEKTLIGHDQTAEEKRPVLRYREYLPEIEHDILIAPTLSSLSLHSSNATDIVVKDGEYFMLGDNRPYSNDSRDWGFVPDHLLVGKVEYVIISVNKSNIRENGVALRANRFLKNVYACD
jgi:signal peptidase I